MCYKKRMRFSQLLNNPKPIKNAEPLKRHLVKIAKKHRLQLLIIFGSLARKKMTALSDIDIAYLKIPSLTLDKQMKLLGDLQNIFHREDIDLVELTKASPLLKMAILKDCFLIYSKSRKDLIDFRYKTITSFLATQYLRNQFLYYVKKAVLGGI